MEDVGVSPQVIHTPEQVRAATPLAHSKVTIVKLHGDYLDLEQRNTVDELSTYPDAHDRLLDRIFDDYGLIVSGWSADWDHALVAALERRATRRYPLFGVPTRSPPRRPPADRTARRRPDREHDRR